MILDTLPNCSVFYGVGQRLALVSLLLVLGMMSPLSAGAADEAGLKERALAVLRDALATTEGWVRVHAAEVLIEHGQLTGIAALYLPEVDTAPPPNRIGVWRVLVRTVDTAERKAEFLARIRTVMRDPNASDRVHAAETLAKLSAGLPEDLAVIEAWLPKVDATAAPFLWWLMVQGSEGEQRVAAIAGLAQMLRDENPVPRVRAAYGLARIRTVPPGALRLLREAAESEPLESTARPYILVAALQHLSPGDMEARWMAELRGILPKAARGAVREIAPALGRRGDRAVVTTLVRLLESEDADIRIGAADGLLHLFP